MNIEHYEKYYSYDALIDEIFQLEQKKIDKYMNLTNLFKIQPLFDFAIENTLCDLAEYLYIFHNAVLSVNKLNSDTVLSISEQSTTNPTISAPLQTQSGTNSGIKLEYFDKTNKKRTELIIRMNNLRKYSKMVSKNKDFYYTFNSKHLEKIFQT